MSEWQPATINLTHPTNSAAVDGHQDINGMVIRVRPIDAKPSRCDAKTMYEVHPADVDRLMPWRNGLQTIICEHEIQTD